MVMGFVHVGMNGVMPVSYTHLETYHVVVEAEGYEDLTFDIVAKY